MQIVLKRKNEAVEGVEEFVLKCLTGWIMEGMMGGPVGICAHMQLIAYKVAKVHPHVLPCSMKRYEKMRRLG